MQAEPSIKSSKQLGLKLHIRFSIDVEAIHHLILKKTKTKSIIPKYREKNTIACSKKVIKLKEYDF